MSKSSLALGNLRGFAILMVVAFHSFIAYLGSQPASPHPFDSPPFGWTANPIIDSQRWFGFDLFCASQYVYLMHLMFFLSGLFVWPSLLRKGAKTFLHGRVIRLGVPFITTLHGRLDFPGLPDLVRRFPDAPFVSISNNQRAPLGDANWLGTAYHGLPVDSFRLRTEIILSCLSRPAHRREGA